MTRFSCGSYFFIGELLYSMKMALFETIVYKRTSHRGAETQREEIRSTTRQVNAPEPVRAFFEEKFKRRRPSDFLIFQ